MSEWFLKILFWIWDNISNIDATISIIVIISGVIIPIAIRISNNHGCLKNFGLDKQTKQSMKYYVPTRGLNIDPCDQENIDDNSGFELISFFMEAFKDSESQYFIILADSGMGKTTFLLNLYFKYRRKIFKRYHIVLFPLSNNETFDEIKKIKNKQKIILLLDSFDEDPYAMDDYVSRLKEICKETELFYKVVMTCRTQFFPDSENEPRITGKMKFGVGKKNVEFEKYYILPFSDSEIHSYLSKKYRRSSQKEKLDQSLKLISNCPQLVIRPMLLSYIDDLIEDQEKKYDNAYEIYDQLVKKWIEREALNNNKLLYEFSEKVAEYMYFNKTVYIGGLKIESLCIEYGIKLRSIEAKSRSLLNRNANGDYKFAHKSIFEFFLFKKALKEKEFCKIIITNGFNGYDMLELFIKEKSIDYIRNILQDNPKEIKSVVFRCIILSKVNFSGINIIDCNFEGCILPEANFAFTTLCNVDLSESFLEKAVFLGANIIDTKLNNANLKNCDFRNANVRNTNLERANLEKAKFEGASLRRINLQKTKLSKASLSWANLKGADLTGADLRETILIDTDLRETTLGGVDLSRVYLSYSKSKNLFEYNHWALEFEDDFKNNLASADLTGADLHGMNLIGINFQFAKLISSNLSKSILANANFTYADFTNANLSDVDLTNTELEASIWDYNNVEMILTQLKNAKFRYIIVENKKRLYRSNLFPVIYQLNSSDKYFNSKEKKKLRASGINLKLFMEMNNDEKIKALEKRGLDPLDFRIY